MEEEYYEFTVEELDAIREGIEEEIFEIKNFGIQKVPVIKLFQKRIERVRELAEIQADLFPEDKKERGIEIQLESFDSQTIRTLFNAYFSNKNKLKQRFFASLSLFEIADMMEKMCENEKTFADKFNVLQIEEGKIVSKELNPMDILSSIDEAEQNGIFTLQDVKDDVNNLPFILGGEIKRLLLLSRKF